jgi:hypothetical protein
MRKETFTKKTMNAFIYVALFTAMLLAGAMKGQAQIITTVAGDDTTTFDGNNGNGGPATDAALGGFIYGIAVDANNNLYIADNYNSVVRKVDAAGNITTVVGNGTAGYGGDNGPALSAELQSPYGMAFDKLGNLYISDYSNNRVRKVTPAGTISTVAGKNTYGYSGDNGPATAAKLSNPAAVAFDTAGNMYIADQGNNVVRKVDAAGTITTVAGTPGSYGFSGDAGPATDAVLGTIYDITVDIAGNIYIADGDNAVIRKVTTDGNINTIAGSNTLGEGYSGDGSAATAAQLQYPGGVRVDAAGNLYISDDNNYLVRKVNTAGIISTVAGVSGLPDDGTGIGDGGLAINANIFPDVITLDTAGNIYIAETTRVRKVIVPLPCSAVTAGAITNSGSSIFCGSASADTLLLTGASAGGSIAYQWQYSINDTTWTNTGADTVSYVTNVANTTTYYRAMVTCTSANLTDSTASDTITVNPMLVPSVVITAAPDTNISEGQPVTFTAAVTNGGSTPAYQWKKNGIDIAGATANSYIANTPASNDMFTCVAYSNAVCPDSAESNSLTIHINTGVGAIAGNANVRIYPNPASAMVYVDAPAAVNISVLSMEGKLLLQQRNATSVNMGSLADGIYLIQVTDKNDALITRKTLIKMAQ